MFYIALIGLEMATEARAYISKVLDLDAVFDLEAHPIRCRSAHVRHFQEGGKMADRLYDDEFRVKFCKFLHSSVCSEL